MNFLNRSFNTIAKNTNFTQKRNISNLLPKNISDLKIQPLIHSINKGSADQIAHLVKTNTYSKDELNKAQIFSDHLIFLESTNKMLLPYGKTVICGIGGMMIAPLATQPEFAEIYILVSPLLLMWSGWPLLFPMKWIFEYCVLNRRGIKHRIYISNMIKNITMTLSSK